MFQRDINQLKIRGLISKQPVYDAQLISIFSLERIAVSVS